MVDFYFHRQSHSYNIIFKELSLLLPKIYRLRNIGSLALSLSYFTDNHYGVVINKAARLWDLAAVDLIIQQAGGGLFGSNGKKLILDYQNNKKTYSLIACHPDNIDELISK